MHPPSPEMRSPAGRQPSRASSHPWRSHAEESDIAVIELQARQLRDRFAVGYRFACSLALLVWGVPR